MNSMELLISIIRNSPDFMAGLEGDLGSSLTPEPLGSDLSELDLEEGFDMSTPEQSDSPYSDITQLDGRSIYPSGGTEAYNLQPPCISTFTPMGKTPPQYTPPPRYRRKSLPPPPSYEAHQSRVHRRRYWSHQQQRRRQPGGGRTPPPSYDEAVFGHLLRDTRDFGYPQSPVEFTDSNPSFSPSDFATGHFPDSPSSGDNSPGIFSSPTPDYFLPPPPFDGENLRRILTAETPVESPPRQTAVDGWAECGGTTMEGALSHSGFPAVNSGADVPAASSPVIERNSPNPRVEESTAQFGGRSVKENLYHFFDRKRGNNIQTAGGHYFLWQYLLEVLFTHDTSLMEWIGEEGEFVFRDPEKVSRGWFKRKNPAKKSNNDNYETMTRSIRYYYDRHMMAKVNGRKYTYKFLLPGLLRFVQNGGGMTDPEFLSNHISASEFDRVKNFVLTPSP